MKPFTQIEITVNNNQRDYKKNHRQIMRWLKSSLPMIMSNERMASEKVFLRTTNEETSFCLS